ncbi:HEAT repeat domain-containing protein [Chitinophaga qingshengii]|uniref:HEAT repeat domain-containing protein n=1 Tax=Chitinophaga qingshengii TaxID=1569794 RepID=A0ABR7TH12_9BACT|nr:HEAT repeat domain-containing protein [Chitinophaga qingshengii]MBC9929777.1 HEAT repeat domain-containing protein [Chitinophaga qingshengii]
MDQYLIELIDRMNDTSDMPLPQGVSSSKSISFIALREAEKIQDARYVPQLIDFINIEKDLKKRHRAYFTLAHIAKNTDNETAMVFLISRVDKEKDKYVLSALLEGIADLKKPAGTNLTPLITATKNKAWDVRQSAIKSLAHSAEKTAETALLEVIHTSKNEYDLIYANMALSSSGTPESLPSLVKLLEHKRQDVSGTALSAILKLGDASYLPLFLEQLEKGKNKFTALYGVIKHGGEAVVPNLVHRVRQLVAKQRAIEAMNTAGQTEIMVALEFLVQYAAGNQEIRKLYELLTGKKSALLWDREKQWLQKFQQHFK